MRMRLTNRRSNAISSNGGIYFVGVLIAMTICLTGVCSTEAPQAHSASTSPDHGGGAHDHCTGAHDHGGAHAHGGAHDNCTGAHDHGGAHDNCTGAHDHGQNATTTMPAPTMSPAEIKQKLVDFRIIDDIVDTAPQQRLDVWFSIHTAEFGNIMHEELVAKPPILLLWKYNPGEYFTIIATGPDVPTAEEPTDAEWRHWLVINVPGNEINKGHVLRDYVGFGNETRLGFHRMVFLVFKQFRPYQRSEEAILRHSTTAYRGFFSTRNFIKTQSLGELVAANFIIANCTHPIHDPNYVWSTTTEVSHNHSQSDTPQSTIGTTQFTGREFTVYAETEPSTKAHK